MKLEFAAEAEADFEAVADFIARDSPRQALLFITELREACERLTTFPRRYPVVHHDKRGEIRKALHGNYLIFFKIEEDTIYVIHILHGATDYQARFPDP
ncbi:type II toxin-antitoxin system RelE/ParE family toxin [Novosphingobium sp.]|uniref:type II toxin-antitoxin system RelE/ParE family toxin n=1 Tax=Novosphingobium sp. TaxID=1874826 RepID=UPI001DBD883C|nr:type II toxin-antitoxin system RelE/ParE family toxin [Novosphingobium sp.]MBX9663862.1 type II toxin-antitoxin system RelE/ParE family toxin [Novosphingobium sp.]